MNFFLDENFPKAAAEMLEKLGDRCYDPRGTDLEWADDASLIVIALKRPNREAIWYRLEWLLDQVALGDLAGRVFQLCDHRVVARPPLSE